MAQGKRGKFLESKIEQTNNMYKAKGWALVDKVPTPWNVSYNRRTGKVFQAFPEEKGTVDFVGISQGNSIAFDAKSTDNKTSFPLKNIKHHQVKYLEIHQEQGGISFMIVDFDKLRKVFLLTYDQLKIWWVDSFRKGRKSIPYSFFNNECKQIASSRGVAVDYLEELEWLTNWT